jgi:hypothetical protein
MEKILKEHEIDIVISAVGGGNILDQLTLIEAIKSVGTIKVYIPLRIICAKNNTHDPILLNTVLNMEKRNSFVKTAELIFCCMFSLICPPFSTLAFDFHRREEALLGENLGVPC